MKTVTLTMSDEEAARRVAEDGGDRTIEEIMAEELAVEEDKARKREYVAKFKRLPIATQAEIIAIHHLEPLPEFR